MPLTAVALGTGGGSERWAVPPPSSTFTEALTRRTPEHPSLPGLTEWNPSLSPRHGDGESGTKKVPDAVEENGVEARADESRLRGRREGERRGGGECAKRVLVRAK